MLEVCPIVPPKLTQALDDVLAPLNLREGKITTLYGTTETHKQPVAINGPLPLFTRQVVKMCFFIYFLGWFGLFSCFKQMSITKREALINKYFPNPFS